MAIRQNLQRRRQFLADGCAITRADLAEVWRKREAMLAGGYPLVAVHSPWSLACPPDTTGKKPLSETVNGEPWPWTKGHSQDRLMRVTAVSANTGVLLGGKWCLIALDIDPAKAAPESDQQAFALAVLRLILSDPVIRAMHGLVLTRMRSPASLLILLRTDRLMTKQKVAGMRGAVELLGEGQQCLVDGWHPRSLRGAPVRWTWHRDRAPWKVPVGALPVVSADDGLALLNRIGASGIFGSPIQAASGNRSAAPGRSRQSAYAATDRLRELFDKHNRLVRPAIRELIEQVGREGRGRHDALVAIAGRLVFQQWDDAQALAFVVPLVNQHFNDGDWTQEIQRALDHARRRHGERISKSEAARWNQR